VLLYQYTATGAQEWLSLRQRLSHISTQGNAPLSPYASKRKESPTISILVMKSRIGQLSLAGHRPTLRNGLLNTFHGGHSESKPYLPWEQASGSSRRDGWRMPPVNARRSPAWRMPPGAANVATTIPVKAASHGGCGLGSTPLQHGASPLSQGSILLLACDTHPDMVSACAMISGGGSRVGAPILVGGFYFGRKVTHLDVAKLAALTPLASHQLPITMERPMASLVNEGLLYHQRRLLQCFGAYRDMLMHQHASIEAASKPSGRPSS
jgi:hypothetical protein